MTSGAGYALAATLAASPRGASLVSLAWSEATRADGAAVLAALADDGALTAWIVAEEDEDRREEDEDRREEDEDRREEDEDRREEDEDRRDDDSERKVKTTRGGLDLGKSTTGGGLAIAERRFGPPPILSADDESSSEHSGAVRARAAATIPAASPPRRHTSFAFYPACASRVVAGDADGAVVAYDLDLDLDLDGDGDGDALARVGEGVVSISIPPSVDSASVANTPRHASAVACVACHPAGWQCVTGGGARDGVAYCWDLAGMTGRAPGSAQHALKWDMGAVTDASYSPCGRLIVLACSNDRSGPDGAHRVLVWSAVSGRLCRWYDAHRGAVTARSWAPKCRATEGFSSTGGNAAAPRLEENALVTGCEDGAVRLWFVCASPQGEGKPAHERWGGGEETEEEEEEEDEEEEAADDESDGDGEEDPSSDGWVSRRASSARTPGGAAAVLAAAHSPGGGKIAIARGTGEVAVLAARTFDAELERRLGRGAARALAWAPGRARRAKGEGEEGGETRGRRRRRRRGRRGSDDDAGASDDDSSDDSDDSDDSDSSDTSDVVSDVSDTTRSAPPSPSSSPPVRRRRPSSSSTSASASLLLAYGGDDGAIRLAFVPSAGDDRHWWDADRGVVPAVGPGAAGLRDALPASAFVAALGGSGGVSRERVALALSGLSGDGGDPGGSAAELATLKSLFLASGGGGLGLLSGGTTTDAEAIERAAARVRAWEAELEKWEVEADAARSDRERVVRDEFPALAPSRRRAFNAAHAERMRPIRERRGFLARLVRRKGLVDEDELRAEEERERGVRAEELGKAWGERDASDV